MPSRPIWLRTYCGGIMPEFRFDNTLQKIITIQQSGARSIRLEDDLFQDELAQGYVLTAQGLNVLERIFKGIKNKGARAWTLTGPYGSGKSFFGLFLSSALDGFSAAQTARQKLAGARPDLAEEILLWTGKTHGLLTIPVTGARASLQDCLVRGIEKAFQRLNKSLATPLLQELEKARQADSRKFLDWVRHFVRQVSSPEGGYTGVLIIFDELGKALEHAAAHPHEADVYLLQELAEFASRSGETPFVFIGILHQAFEQYASHLDHATQREWAKVQGRFEDIPFLEPPAQQMRLLARTIQAHEIPIQAQKQISTAIERALEADWRPTMMPVDEFRTLSVMVYPLHPSTFSALPFFFRRLGQNERSIFTYLTSHEPYGFQEFLSNNAPGAFIRLPNLFDYLAANYEGRIYASGRARPLIEALERLENTPNLSSIEQDLLKTISLLNWLGEVSHLLATEARILSALTESSEEESILRAGLETLKRRSLIAYRGFNQTYVVWQGSDVDIEERLQAAYAAQSGGFSMADVLQAYLPPRPLIAHRHSYQTGTLRFFDVRYVDSLNREKVSLLPTRDASGVILLCLPATLTEVERFSNWAQTPDLARQTNLVIGVAGRAIRLRELVQELRGLHWIKENTPELSGDRVAARELRTRIAMMETLIRNELDEALNLRQISALSECQWFYRGNVVSERTRRGLSALLSDICDSLYPAAPQIRNELLNRRELTSQGAAARRNLIEGILTHAEQPLLGIQGFPPERSMYESLLRVHGMHRLDGESWKLFPPEGNLLPVWDAIYDFVFSPPAEPRPLTDLYSRLNNPPFGLTQGVIPVLLAVFYKVFENEMTLYKDGTLLVTPEIADWEVLLRRPELFSLAGCRVTGMHGAIVERMARGLRVPPFVMPVARALITRLKALPEHTWRTQRLSTRALALRRAVDLARSPERFLFQEIPEALEMPAFMGNDFNPAVFQDFFERLNQTLEELSSATPRLLEWARDTWLTACGFPVGEAGWDAFRLQAQTLVARVTHPQLIPLIKRAAETPNPHAALESVLAQIANRPPRSWTDADSERFAAQSQYLGNLLQRELREEPLDTPIDPELHQRSEQLAAELEQHLHRLTDDPLTAQQALKILLRKLRS